MKEQNAWCLTHYECPCNFEHDKKGTISGYYDNNFCHATGLFCSKENCPFVYFLTLYNLIPHPPYLGEE